MKNARLFVAVWIGLFIVGNSESARATEIFPGFDLFATSTSPPVTFVDLTVQSGGLVGVVPLKGNPFGPANTDTIVQRLAGSGLPFNVGDVAVIPIELVALSLMSVAPIDIGGTLYDMDVISGSLMGEPANPLGSMTVSHSVANGGTFLVTSLLVNYKATFTDVANIAPPFSINSGVLFQNTNGVWSHTPGPNDVHGGPYQPGGFYAGVDPHSGEKVIMAHVTPDEEHYTEPSCFSSSVVPEPSTIVLACLGLLGLGIVALRRKYRRA